MRVRNVLCMESCTKKWQSQPRIAKKLGCFTGLLDNMSSQLKCVVLNFSMTKQHIVLQYGQMLSRRSNGIVVSYYNCYFPREILLKYAVFNGIYEVLVAIKNCGRHVRSGKIFKTWRRSII